MKTDQIIRVYTKLVILSFFVAGGALLCQKQAKELVKKEPVLQVVAASAKKKQDTKNKERAKQLKKVPSAIQKSDIKEKSKTQKRPKATQKRVEMGESISLYIPPSLEEINKRAGTAYLQWKIRDPYSALSPDLKKALTPRAIKYIVDKSQIPFHGELNDRDVYEKVHVLMHEFRKKFGERLNTLELYAFLAQEILPQHIFQKAPRPLLRNDRVYSKFLDALQEHITPLNTTLQDWALRYLTSESLFLALPMIEAIERDGKSFSQLTPNEKKEALDPVVDIITQRFLTNLEAVEDKESITLPSRLDQVVSDKIRHFLYRKFISVLE